MQPNGYRERKCGAACDGQQLRLQRPQGVQVEFFRADVTGDTADVDIEGDELTTWRNCYSLIEAGCGYGPFGQRNAKSRQGAHRSTAPPLVPDFFCHGPAGYHAG